MRGTFCKIRMAELYDAGCSDYEIARQMGCMPTTVSEWRYRTGRLACNQHRPKGTLAPRIKKLLVARRSIKEIACAVGCGEAYVRAVKRRLRPGVVSAEARAARARHLSAIGRAA